MPQVHNITEQCTDLLLGAAGLACVVARGGAHNSVPNSRCCCICLQTRKLSIITESTIIINSGCNQSLARTDIWDSKQSTQTY